ncbi:UNVERIFIED_CONTAM: hypothetical protein NCL1_07097 [Trichonephila clavipes]
MDMNITKILIKHFTLFFHKNVLRIRGAALESNKYGLSNTMSECLFLELNKFWQEWILILIHPQLNILLPVQNKPLVTIFDKTLAIDKINLFQCEGPLIEVQKYRKCTVKAFQFLLNSLQHVTSKYCKVDSRDCSITSDFPFSKLLFSILSEVKNLLIFIGRISNVSNLVHIMDFKETSLCAEYYYHYVHLYLDIWWHCITILLTLNHLPFRKEKFESFCNDVDQLDPFLQWTISILR